MARTQNKVAIETLQKLFELKDGLLLWKAPQGSKVKPGQLAGGIASNGYRIVWVDGLRVGVHRVTYAMHHGYWPSKEIDHIDGNKLNNHPDNLREVTHVQNMQNMRRKNGKQGVFWDKARMQWRVEVGHKYFGRWDSLEFAELVATEARQRLFGEFAPVLS